MSYNKAKISIVVTLLVLLTLVLSPDLIRTRADNIANRIFDGNLVVTIHEGPSALSGPVTLSGHLKAKLAPDGGFTGTLTPSEGQNSVVFGNLLVDDPTKIDVVGQINGRAFNLVLDLGNGKNIYGSGSAKNDLSKVKDAGGIGGAAVGPELGDRDDWILGDGSVRGVR